MSALSFKLDAFEGPLDLLLHLIAKHKLNIYDIEITLLLDQYMAYIDSAEEQDLETAGDFLAMAARLVYIKTCSLLPRPEEAEELKKELQGDLIEYSVCKQAAARLRELCVYGEVFVRPPEKLPVNKTFTGSVDPQKLIDAYMGMSEKSRRMKPVRAERFSPIVAARFVTVTSKIVYVLKKLYRCGECTVDELYEGIDDRSSRVATFLAVLELTRSGRIYLNDDNTLIKFNKNSKRKHIKNDLSERASVPAATLQTEPEERSEREKYLPEQRENLHRLTLADFSPPEEDDIEVTEQPDEEADIEIAEQPPDEISDTVSDVEADERGAVKPNRFSARYRWGYPLAAGNCWRYGKERAL